MGKDDVEGCWVVDTGLLSLKLWELDEGGGRRMPVVPALYVLRNPSG